MCAAPGIPPPGGQPQGFVAQGLDPRVQHFMNNRSPGLGDAQQRPYETRNARNWASNENALDRQQELDMAGGRNPVQSAKDRQRAGTAVYGATSQGNGSYVNSQGQQVTPGRHRQTIQYSSYVNGQMPGHEPTPFPNSTLPPPEGRLAGVATGQGSFGSNFESNSMGSNFQSNSMGLNRKQGGKRTSVLQNRLNNRTLLG